MAEQAGTKAGEKITDLKEGRYAISAHRIE